MLLIFSSSNPEVHLVLGFSNSGSFWLVLLSSQLLCWYHSASYLLFLFLIPLIILHFSHVLSRYPICYSKIIHSHQHLVFHYWYLLCHPSVDKLFFDFRQTFCWSYADSLSPHIFSALLFLHGVFVSALLSLFLLLLSLSYISFQVPHILSTSSF